MSDKFNKDLENLGWTKMRDLLDESMPVKRKRRPFLFYWLPAAVVVCLVGTALLFTMFKTENNDLSINEDAQTMVQENHKITETQSTSNQAAKSISKSDISSPEKSESINNKAIDDLNKIQEDKLPQIIPNTTVKYVKPENDNVNSAPDNIELKSSIVQNAAEQIIRTNFNVNALALLQNGSIEAPFQPLDLNNSPFKHSRKNRIIYGIQMASNIEIPSFNFGASGGFSLEMPIINSPWSLESGAYYRHYGKKKPFSIEKTLIEDDNIRSFQMLGYPQGFTDFVVNEQNELISNNGRGQIDFNETQSFIGIPILINWHASQRIVAKFGVQYERQLPNWFQNTSYYANEPQLDGAFDSSSFINYQTAFPIQAQKDKFFISTGLRIQLTPRIGLESCFNYQINNSVKNLPISIKDHSIKIGLQYKLGILSF